MSGHEGELYGDDLIGMLEVVWGEGFLSPGGPDEVDRVVAGAPIAGARVLDIGCGVGGVDRHLVVAHGAAHVTGIDVEDTVLATARQRAARDGLDDRLEFVRVEPGPLPFDDACFDVVFSKDSCTSPTSTRSLVTCSECWRRAAGSSRRTG